MRTPGGAVVRAILPAFRHWTEDEDARLAIGFNRGEREHTKWIGWDAYLFGDDQP